MRLKKFILFTVILSIVFIGIGTYFNTPLAFISNDASSFEYVITNLILAITKAVVILSIFVHIKNNVKLENLYGKKKKFI